MNYFAHWTPRYLCNRVQEVTYRVFHPHAPWLTPQANQILTVLIKPTDIGLEFGSGRSTLWLAQRVRHLTSVEHNTYWYDITQKKLQEKNISNTTYHFIPKEDADEEAGSNTAYVKIGQAITDNSLNFVLVDGIYRGQCCLTVLRKIRPGGLLILDNANRYIPSQSYCPYSRTYQNGPYNTDWQTFLEQVSQWKLIWTSNGVTDTALYFKPVHAGSLS